MSLDRKQLESERRKGRAFFEGLSHTEKWELGDRLVLGDFDWRDWGLSEKPSSAFLQAVDEARITWEMADA